MQQCMAGHCTTLICPFYYLLICCCLGVFISGLVYFGSTSNWGHVLHRNRKPVHAKWLGLAFVALLCMLLHEGPMPISQLARFCMPAMVSHVCSYNNVLHLWPAQIKHWSRCVTSEQHLWLVVLHGWLWPSSIFCSSMPPEGMVQRHLVDCELLKVRALFGVGMSTLFLGAALGLPAT